MKKTVAIITAVIVIVLIGVGVVIFNDYYYPAVGTRLQINTMAVAEYNSRFVPYFGSNKSSNSVKALIKLVEEHNSSEEVTKWGIISIIKQKNPYFVRKEEPEKINIKSARYDFPENSIKEDKLYTIGLISTNKSDAISKIGIYEQNQYLTDRDIEIIKIENDNKTKIILISILTVVLLLVVILLVKKFHKKKD